MPWLLLLFYACTSIIVNRVLSYFISTRVLAIYVKLAQFPYKLISFLAVLNFCLPLDTISLGPMVTDMNRAITSKYIQYFKK